MKRIATLLIATVVLVGVGVGGTLGVQHFAGDGATKWQTVAPTAAAPTEVPTIDPASRAPIHNAVEILHAFQAQGWDQSEGCSNQPSWFPRGLGLVENGKLTGAHGRARVWGLECYPFAGVGIRIPPVCPLMDDVTLVIIATERQAC